MRWLIPLVLAVVVIGSQDASAQAFKPRGKTPAAAPAKPAAKKSTPAAKSSKSSPRKAASTKSSKTSRVASEGRPDDLTPDSGSSKKGSAPEDADDYVMIEDDDE